MDKVQIQREVCIVFIHRAHFFQVTLILQYVVSLITRAVFGLSASTLGPLLVQKLLWVCQISTFILEEQHVLNVNPK